MKYETQVAAIKPVLAEAKNVLVVLPAQASTDILAAGLAFYLALKQKGKEAAIVTESPVLVENSNLFGAGEIKNTFPQSSGGDFVISLENVVMPDGSVPALEKLDWYPEGANLNLVFHVLAGQRFEPAKVDTKHAGGKFDLIVTIGVTALTEMGNIYNQNQTQFNEIPILNVDNNAMNSSFGQAKVLDSTTSQSQIVAQVLPDLGLMMDVEVASNLLAGIYDATKGLTVGVTPETFMVVGQAMQAGGRIPGSPVAPNASLATAAPVASTATPSAPVPTVPVQSPIQQPNPLFNPPPTPSPTFDQAALNQGFDLRAFQQQPTQPVANPPQPVEAVPTQDETTAGNPDQSVEDASFNPQPDWLTPKVYKGSGGAG